MGRPSVSNQLCRVSLATDHIRNTQDSDNVRPTRSDNDIQYLDDILMVEGFENLDLPKRSDGHTILFIMHQDSLEGHIPPSGSVCGPMHLTDREGPSDRKSEVGTSGTNPKVPSPSLFFTSYSLRRPDPTNFRP